MYFDHGAIPPLPISQFKFFQVSTRSGDFFSTLGQILVNKKTEHQNPFLSLKLLKDLLTRDVRRKCIEKLAERGAPLVKSTSLNECKSGVCYVLKNLSFRDTNDAGNLMSVVFLNEHCESMNYFESMQKLQKHFQPTTLSGAQSLCSPKRFIPAII